MDKVSYAQAYSIALGLFSSRFSHIERGNNNWVFESGDSILTIPRHERVKSYAIRVNATQFLGSKGIPVPEILDYSPEKNETPEYLLVKKVKGANIELSKSSSEEREKIHQSAGEILRELHNLTCSRYGRLNSDLFGEEDSWIAFTDKFFTESIKRVRLSPGLYEQFGKILEEEYESSRSQISSFFHPSFLHADFHLGNLLFKNGKVSAILDIDIVTSGDTNWDTGHYCHTFNIDRVNGIKNFRAGYDKDADLDKERLYCIMIWARKIGSQVTQRPEALKETIPELERILRREI